MKKRVFVLISFVAIILVIAGNAFAQDGTSKTSIPAPPHILSSEWKAVRGYKNRVWEYFNTKRITYLPGGIVKVWEFDVPRGEERRLLVNALKMVYSSEGKDPNNAKRLFYDIFLDKFNCKTHQYAITKIIDYSFGQTVLFSHSVQPERWNYIGPGNLEVAVENYVCKKYKEEK